MRVHLHAAAWCVLRAGGTRTICAVWGLYVGRAIASTIRSEPWLQPRFGSAESQPYPARKLAPTRFPFSRLQTAHICTVLPHQGS